ncbi:MAG: hypothetical protein JXQ29_16790 [Planctomycetes bacterium]|nr:hypothetical protein [Planctomycetota bacterium]
MAEKRFQVGTIHALGRDEGAGRRASTLSKSRTRLKYFYNFDVVEHPGTSLEGIEDDELVFLYAFPDEPLRAQLVERGNPVICGFFFTPEGVFHTWQYERQDFLRRCGVRVLAADDMSFLRKYALAAVLKRYMREKRVTAFERAASFTWDEPVAKAGLAPFGVALEGLPVEKLLDYRRIHSDEVEEVTDRLLPAASRAISRDEVKEAVRLYWFLKRLPDNLAVTVKCLDKGVSAKLMDGEFLVTPCLAAALLGEECVGFGGEGDWISAFSSFVVQYLTERPCFMTNVYPQAIHPAWGNHLQVAASQLAENQVVLCHCAYVGAVPPSLAASWRLVRKMDLAHQNMGVMVDATLAPGRYSLARFNTHVDAMSVFEGTVSETRDTGLYHGRVLAVLDLDYSSRALSHHLVSHHQIVFPGSADELTELLEVAGIPAERIR